jgi:WhiB family redox-sensing transcriptional regulator
VTSPKRYGVRPAYTTADDDSEFYSHLLDLVNSRPEWHKDAACKQVDVSFFPGRGIDQRPIKAICKGCPVRQECLDFALDNNENYGVWGGTSERERRHIRKMRRNRELAIGEADTTVTVREVAEILMVSIATVHDWCRKGLIPFQQVGTGNRRYQRADIEMLREQRAIGGTAA